MKIEMPIPERERRETKKGSTPPPPPDAREGELQILEKPPEEDFESKLRQFESQNVDDVKNLAMRQGPLSPDSPEPLEKEQDPVYSFLEAVVEGKVSEEDFRELAKPSCGHCYGRGYEGFQKTPERDIPVACRCVLKVVKKGNDARVSRIIQSKIREAVQ